MIRRQIATQRFIVAANMGPQRNPVERAICAEHGTPKPWPGRPAPRTQPRDSK